MGWGSVLASTERSYEEYDALPRDLSAGLQTPPAFGRYRVVHQVGVGVLGPVFRGYDPEQDRVVAIKAFFLDLTPEQAADLASEFDRLAALAIPHAFIITPFAGGVDGSTAFLAEEYFVAESTDVALKQYGPPPVSDALRLIGQLAGALDAAAEVGVHHGALHPRDVLVAPHEMRLTGLGVVPAIERVGLRVQPRIPYAAPERMAGQPVTHASDVFSLACLSFELLTGHRPVPSGDTVMVDTSGIQAADVSALSEVFARVLSDRAEDRHPSALAFAAALKHALTGAPLQAATEIEPPKPRRAAKGRKAAVLPFDDDLPATPSDHPPLAISDDAPLAAPIAASEQPDIAAAVLPGEVAPEAKKAARRARAPRPRVTPDNAAPPSLLDVDEPSAQVAEPVAATPPEASLDVVGEELTVPVEIPLDEPQPALPAAPEPESVPPAALEPESALPVTPEPESAIEPEPVPVPDLEPVAESAPAQGPVEEPDAGPTLEPEQVVVLSPPPAPVMGQPEEPMFSTFSDVPREEPVAASPGRRLAERLGMLAIGLVVGFGVGYFVAPRGAGGPSAAARATRSTSAPTASTSSAPASPPAAQATPAPVQPAPAPAAAAAGTQAAAAPAQAAKPATSAKAVQGTLVVSSRPAGARVLVDGREAGKTPLTLRDVQAGSHKVRLELAGYRPWTLTVRVAAGGQRKLTASLQRRPGG